MDLEKEKIEKLKEENQILEVEKKKEQKFSRVIVSVAVRDRLQALANVVNYGFMGGEVGPTEIVEWMVGKTKKGFSAQELQDIRMAYTDEKQILEMILAGAAKASDLPEALRKAIREVSGLGPKRPYQRGYEEREKAVFEARLDSLKKDIGGKG